MLWDVAGFDHAACLDMACYLCHSIRLLDEFIVSSSMHEASATCAMMDKYTLAARLCAWAASPSAEAVGRRVV